MNRLQVGLYGEIYIFLELLRLFPYCETIHQPGSYSGDILLGKTKIEVKTARKNKRGNYQFNLYKSGHTDFTHAEIVILVSLNLDTSPHVYVIPTELLGHRKQITITPNSSTYDQYINRYDYINQLANRLM